jgi:HEPN domain-containing protein
LTNRERGERLIRAARAIFQRDLAAARAAGDHNLAVRRAQEVVELALKGGLAILGVECPKAHHVGDLFAEQARQKLRAVSSERLERLEEASLWLSEARAPSFYLDRDFTPQDAERAYGDATFVLETVEELMGISDEG